MTLNNLKDKDGNKKLIIKEKESYTKFIKYVNRINYELGNSDPLAPVYRCGGSC